MILRKLSTLYTPFLATLYLRKSVVCIHVCWTGFVTNWFLFLTRVSSIVWLLTLITEILIRTAQIQSWNTDGRYWFLNARKCCVRFSVNDSDSFPPHFPTPYDRWFLPTVCVRIYSKGLITVILMFKLVFWVNILVKNCVFVFGFETSFFLQTSMVKNLVALFVAS